MMGTRKLGQYYILLFFVPLTLTAAPPPGTSYNNFNATGGIISSPCPTNYSCSLISEGAGFFQRELIPNAIDSQEHYIQTISVDSDASGNPAQLPMVIESFIQFSQSGATTTTVNGFSGRETLLDSAADSNFRATTAIDNGWAAVAGQANVRIDQNIDNNQVLPGERFTDQFQYRANHDVSGARTGTSLNIQQSLGLNDAGNGNANDQQAYSYQHLQGDMNPTNSSIMLPNGSVLSWTAGDSVTYQQTNQTLAPSGNSDLDFPGSFIQFDFAENQTTNTEIRSAIQAETGTVIPPEPPFPIAP